VVPARARADDRLTPDARRIVAVQAFRAYVYGLGSVVIGISLQHEHLSGFQVGLVLMGLLAGAALVSVLLARYGDRIGRRRAYRSLLVIMGAAGSVFAVTSWTPALVLAALTGTVSTDVVESGPFTSLEQAMLPHATESDPAPLFGIYNTVATISGSFGALTAAAASSRHWLFAYPIAAVAGLVVASGLSRKLEGGTELDEEPRPPLHRSRGIVLRLSGLFAIDSFGGGFVVQTFIAYWFARKFHSSHQAIAAVFFAIGFLQAFSFQAAIRIARRIGLLNTMVFSHLPSNVLLAAVAFAPNFPTAVALLLGRFALSQMDVPTRQAYVVAVVDPSERTAAAAYTNTARYVTRPFAPLVGGAGLGVWLGLPFVIAGALKIVYDIGLYGLFRRVKI